MIKKLTFLLFLCAFAFLAQANAQTDAAAEKQAAIRELMAIFNEDNGIEKLMEIMTAQTDESAKKIFQQTLDEDKTLTPAEKKAASEAFLSDQAGTFKRFQEKMFERLNLTQLIVDISTAVYEKHYTLEEIREIIAFYKKPVGQKTLKLTPVIFAESMQALMEKLEPKLREVTKEVEREMRQEFEQKIKAQKPRPKQPVTK